MNPSTPPVSSRTLTSIEDSDVYQMLQKDQEETHAPRQSGSFRALQDFIDSDGETRLRLAPFYGRHPALTAVRPRLRLFVDRHPSHWDQDRQSPHHQAGSAHREPSETAHLRQMRERDRVSELDVSRVVGRSRGDCRRLSSASGLVSSGTVVKARDKFRHPGCFVCSDCEVNLKQKGYFFVEGQLYCEAHARARMRPPEGHDLVATFPSA